MHKKMFIYILRIDKKNHPKLTERESSQIAENHRQTTQNH